MRFTKALSLVSIYCIFFSCTPDRCKDVVCSNGGVCISGHCSCLNGYEGLHCDTVWNGRFIDIWNVAETTGSDTTRVHYSFQTAGNGFPDQFLILHPGNVADSVLCKRTSPDAFSIQVREIDSLTTISSGSGSISADGKKVIASYSLQLGDSLITHNMTWTK